MVCSISGGAKTPSAKTPWLVRRLWSLGGPCNLDQLHVQFEPMRYGYSQHEHPNVSFEDAQTQTNFTNRAEKIRKGNVHHIICNWAAKDDQFRSSWEALFHVSPGPGTYMKNGRQKGVHLAAKGSNNDTQNAKITPDCHPKTNTKAHFESPFGAVNL